MTDYEKYEKMDKAVDTIRGRFGEDKLIRASYLADYNDKKLAHIAGGIKNAREMVKDKDSGVGGRMAFH
jgi:DNA polymerase-4